MPFSLNVLLENLLRNEDGHHRDARRYRGAGALARSGGVGSGGGILPRRVLMPDSSGVPLLIDLAAMRDAMVARGLDPRRVNPRDSRPIW